MEDPNWPRADSLLTNDQSRETSGCLIGVEFDASISPSQSRKAPDEIRKALTRFSIKNAFERVHLDSVLDLGNLKPKVDDREAAISVIEEGLRELLGGNRDPVIILGGDNAITRPAARALLADLPSAGLLTLDAHHDVRTFYDGPSNGTPVRGLLEDGLRGEAVWQIGIGAFSNSPEYRKWALDQGIRITTAQDVRADGVETVISLALEELSARADSIYVNVDLDVLDRSFAPACPGSRPGGLEPYELLSAVHLGAGHPKVQAIDFVELDPTTDIADITILNAASAVLSAITGFTERS